MTKTTNEIGFPEDYNGPEKKGSEFIKVVPGENEFRILSNISIGYGYWTSNNKPVRQKTKFDATPGIKKDSYAKELWIAKVYDYVNKKVGIWEISQAGIKDDLWVFGNNAKLGGLGNIDLSIKREGVQKETKYTLTPIQTPLTDDVKKADKDSEIDLEAYWNCPYKEDTSVEAYTPEVAPISDNPFA